FLSGSYINHALTVNPHVYISCIKQFWNTVVVKRSGDVTRLQALVDKKRILITEEIVHEILQLNDAKEEVATDVVPPTLTSPSPSSPRVLDTCSALVLRVEGLENDSDEGIELVADQEEDAKSKEEMEKEDKEIIKSINETPAQKSAKRRKLSEEAQEADDLRKRLEIVQDEDDDVFVEATPLA
nr:hypothetical protein [Tanacetum cinerariifolium]